MAEPRMLGISGALRAASTNRLLLGEVIRLFGPAAWQTADLRMPLYDEDLELAEGIPPEAMRLAEQIAAADGIVICTPEYNKMIPGVLKNALDWISRIKGAPFIDKPVAILSAAAGRGGGDRAQFSLRLALALFRVRIVPGPEVLISNSRAAFDEDGRLKDERSVAAITELIAMLKREMART